MGTVTEFADTQRFATPNVGETTTQFYASPAPPVTPTPAPTVTKKFFTHKIFWTLGVILLLSSFAVVMSIWAVENRRDRQQYEAEEAAEILHRSLEVAVQNALGFKHAAVSAAEFPNAQGIFVNSLMSDDSPAALAHLQAGDVLLELNNQPVRNESELEQALNALQTGQEVPVKIYRDGETLTARLRLADRNFPPLQPKIEARDQGFLGIKDSARRCCVPNTTKWGIEVIELHENGPADIFGLRPGDVITEFNGHPTRTPNEFNRRIRAVSPRSKAQLKVYRGNSEQLIEVVLGHRWEN